MLRVELPVLRVVVALVLRVVLALVPRVAVALVPRVALVERVGVPLLAARVLAVCVLPNVRLLVLEGLATPERLLPPAVRALPPAPPAA